MNTEFGLMHMWSQSDGIARAVLVLLILMSLLSWIVMLIKALDVLRAKRQAARVDGFWRSADVTEGLSRLTPADGNPFRDLAVQGREAADQHRATQTQLHDSLDASDWISRALQGSIDQSVTRLQAGLAVLASVGSTAPFVGLFGTVWGIYHALMRISAAGQASLDQVAGPIGESLIMTALGLATAIPAVLAYNALVRGNKHILGRLGRFARDLHAFYLTGARVAAASNDDGIKRS